MTLQWLGGESQNDIYSVKSHMSGLSGVWCPGDYFQNEVLSEKEINIPVVDTNNLGLWKHTGYSSFTQ